MGCCAELTKPLLKLFPCIVMLLCSHNKAVTALACSPFSFSLGGHIQFLQYMSMAGLLVLHRLCLCSAYKNKGVQLLLDGVTTYLPSPLDVTNRALDVNNNQAPLDLPSSCQASRLSYCCMRFVLRCCMLTAASLLQQNLGKVTYACVCQCKPLS